MFAPFSPFFQLSHKVLMKLDPECAHELSIRALKAACLPLGTPFTSLSLKTRLMGLEFPNVIGLAAGFDKNAEVASKLFALGFGHVEVGTLTPQPQTGNDKPRLFRLVEDEAIINRMGFNNHGHAAALERLKRRKRTQVVGVNIGANKASDDKVNDYVTGIKTFYPVASYFTINVSSPNTPGLRDLQNKDALKRLLGEVQRARAQCCAEYSYPVPVLLKIAPDITLDHLDAIVAQVKESQLDGMIVSNTTVTREGLCSSLSSETGGLSGRPVFLAATRLLAQTRQRVGKDFPLVGVGGVFDGRCAYEKIRAGADLVQAYTGFVYKGPDFVPRLCKDLERLLCVDGFSDVRSARDSGLEDWLRA